MDLPWVEKYRPRLISDFIIDEWTKTLLDSIAKESITHLILYGSPGSGKTSLAYYLSKQLGFSFKELNASDSRGVTNIQEIITFYKKNFEKNTIIILDEADNITLKAQDLIVHIMDTYPKIIFFFTCNNIDEISFRIKERVISVKIEPSDNQTIKKRIKDILRKEDLECNDDIINLVMKESRNDIRMILNKMEYFKKTYSSNNIHIAKNEYNNDSKIQTVEIFRSIILKDFDSAVEKYESYKNKSLNMQDFISLLLEVTHNDDHIEKRIKLKLLDIVYSFKFRIVSLYIYDDLQIYSLIHNLVNVLI
jgi:replication factor C subunit 2/4